MKTLSVVLPNYNHGQYLKYSITAICEQKRVPDQLIVMDDASTDNSIEILEQYRDKYNININIFRNEYNVGVVDTLNNGLAHVDCDYVYFASADDIVLPMLFSKSMEMLEYYPEANICSSLSMTIDTDNNRLGFIKSPLISSTKKYISPVDIKNKYIWNGSWLMGDTTIYKTASVIEKSGFDKNLLSYTDNFLSMMLSFASGACFIPEVLAAWRRSNYSYADSISNDIEAMKSIYIYAKKKIDVDYKDVCNGEVYQAWDARMKYELVSRAIKNKVMIDNDALIIEKVEKGTIKHKLVNFIVKNDLFPTAINKILAALLFVPKHTLSIPVNLIKWHIFLLGNKKT